MSLTFMRPALALTLALTLAACGGKATYFIWIIFDPIQDSATKR